MSVAVKSDSGRDDGHGSAARAELLRDRLESVKRNIESLQRDLDGLVSSEPGPLLDRMAQLEERLFDVEEDRRNLSSRLAEVEQRTARVMNLYVASHELHASLEPSSVARAIGDVAVNLLGAESYALMIKSAQGGECEVLLSEEVKEGSSFQLERYVGGDTLVDRALAGGGVHLGPEAGSEAVAAVSLQAESEVVGVLVILKLMTHKPELLDGDRDVLDLLAAHAATALLAARVYSNSHRKIRTLEGLLELVRQS